MATSSVTLSPGYNLTGTTSGRNSAPITYSLNGVQLGQAASTGGFEYTGSRNSDGETYTLVVAGRTVASNLTSGQLETITAALRPATGQIERNILSEVRVAAPASPAPTPAPTAFRPAPVTTPIVQVDPNDFIGTDSSRSPVRFPPPIDSELEGSPEFQAQSAATPITDEPLAISVLSEEELATPVIDQALLDELAADASSQVAEAIAQIPFQPRADWRVRLSLSDDPSVNYLYKAPNPGILKPLNATNGVLFPYTPQISVNYSANYNPTDLVHSNYKVFQYSNSSIDSINITCEFTAQDEYEANYLLAVIHFFRSATKMFYGQDQNPRRGTPPPLCYIYGMGSYQFAGQPLAISGFNYNLPNNVDYIQTTVGGSNPSTAAATTPPDRTAGTGVAPGGVTPPPQFAPIAEPNSVSWVPSKIQLSVSCVPMMSRNQVSNEFSFEKYATGTLLNGVYSQTGGFW